MSDWDFKPIEEKKAEDTIKENPSEAEGRHGAGSAGCRRRTAGGEGGPDGTGGGEESRPPPEGRTPKRRSRGRRRAPETEGTHGMYLRLTRAIRHIPTPYQHGGTGRATAAVQRPSSPAITARPYPPGNGYPMPPYPPQGNAWCRSRGGYPPPKKKSSAQG